VRDRLARIIGLCLFAVAFFLPAVKDSDRGISYGGWYCAAITLAQSMPWANRGIDLNGFVRGIPFLIDGWVNPLVIIYLAFVALHLANVEFRGSKRVRRVVIYSALICVIDCWVVMAVCDLVPLVGHFLWIGGILLMITPEFFDLSTMHLRSSAPRALEAMIRVRDQGKS